MLEELRNFFETVLLVNFPIDYENMLCSRTTSTFISYDPHASESGEYVRPETGFRCEHDFQLAKERVDLALFGPDVSAAVVAALTALHRVPGVLVVGLDRDAATDRSVALEGGFRRRQLCSSSPGAIFSRAMAMSSAAGDARRRVALPLATRL